MQQYQQHVPMTDMGLFSLAIAELECSSFCLSTVSPGVTDGGSRGSLHSEMTLLKWSEVLLFMANIWSLICYQEMFSTLAETKDLPSFLHSELLDRHMSLEVWVLLHFKQCEGMEHGVTTSLLSKARLDAQRCLEFLHLWQRNITLGFNIWT